MIRYLMRMATADMTVKSVGANDEIEGKELANLWRRWSISRTTANAPRAAWAAIHICSTRCWKLSPERKGVLRKEGRTLRSFPGSRPDGQSRRRAREGRFQDELSPKTKSTVFGRSKPLLTLVSISRSTGTLPALLNFRRPLTCS